MVWGTPPPLRHGPETAGQGASGRRVSSRVWRGAIFKGESLPALPPPSGVSPLAPQRAPEDPVSANPRPSSPPRVPSAPLRASPLRSERRRGNRRWLPAARAVPRGWRSAHAHGAPPPPPRPPVLCRGAGGLRDGWPREEGECESRGVRACARVRVCARRGRRRRPLRSGSAPAGEGLRGLAPLELGICGRSLSIFVES